MTHTDAPGEAVPALRPLGLEAIQLTDDEIAAAADRASLESDPERGWSCYLRGLAITALKSELRRRRLPVVVGPELEPEAPERLLLLDGRCTQLICASPLADELEVSLASWREAATAPQLLLAAVVDEDQGLVEVPGVLDAAAFVAWASEQDQLGEMARMPLAMFQGGIERLERWLLLLDSEALPRVALAAAGPSASGQLVSWLAKGVQTLLEGAVDGLLASLAPQPVPVLSAVRGAGEGTVQLLNPRIEAERNGMPVAKAICSQPTLWVQEPLAEIQLLEGGRLLWRKLARLREPITTPLAWPLPPLAGDELLEVRFRPWGAPGGSFAELALIAPSAERLSEGDSEISLRLSQSDAVLNLGRTLSAIALEVIARLQIRGQE